MGEPRQRWRAGSELNLPRTVPDIRRTENGDREAECFAEGTDQGASETWPKGIGGVWAGWHRGIF